MLLSARPPPVCLPHSPTAAPSAAAACRVLMAAFMAVQPFADTFLSFIPMYYSAKVAFAVYLWFNDLAGAELVYTKFFHPFLAQHEPLVDAKLNESRGVIAGQVTTYTALFMDKARGTLLTLFTQTTQAAVGVSGWPVPTHLSAYWWCTCLVLCCKAPPGLPLTLPALALVCCVFADATDRASVGRT